VAQHGERHENRTVLCWSGMSMTDQTQHNERTRSGLIS